MRHTVYWRLMDAEFGSVRAASLHQDLALSTLGSRTPAEALDGGEDIRAVWTAVCEAAGVPPERWLGPDDRKSTPF